MIILVAVCGMVAVVVNLGPPAWMRELLEQGPGKAAPTEESAEGSRTVQKGVAPEGTRLVWKDDFSGPSGSAPDAGRWKIETGTPGTGEVEYNTRKNVILNGKGQLVITARRQHFRGAEYTSARITSEGRFETTYGRIAARIKTPNGQGLWPAFWLLGTNFRDRPWPDCGEIDIMERRGDRPDHYQATVQGPGYSGVGITEHYSLGPGGDFSDGFHVFSLDWTPDKLIFMIDGYVVTTVERATLPGEWVFGNPFFIVLNLAVGGPYPGDPDASTPFPAKMVVDYVRAYSFPETKITKLSPEGAPALRR
ncbi:glycoside hydrolase family 16 protein [Actinocorallia sp. B10E7]|uniref:glycoside hydrolase family 16 protein n=1 Tax=Actinocorallia sp. B10E7 TaxID=3153558 RepID=UPI00325F7F66